MTVPYLKPRFHSTLPVSEEAAGVSLDVRIGSGRPTRYEFEGTEFSVGGAAGCDLRLPGANVPALVCQIARTPNSLFIQRTDTAFPVLLNGNFLTTNTSPTRLNHGDQIAVGSVDVTVHLGTGYLHPDLQSPANPPPDNHHRTYQSERDPTPPRNTPPSPPTYGPDTTALDEERAELEADRVLWYQRKTEIEAELAAKQAELERFRTELMHVRDNLQKQYEERRQELTLSQTRIDDHAANRKAELDARDRQLVAEHRDRLAALEIETAKRREKQLDDDTSPIRHTLLATATEREAELTEREQKFRLEQIAFQHEREHHAAKLVQFEQHQRELDHRALDVDQRFDQLMRDTVELEEQLKLAEAEQGRVSAEAASLQNQKVKFDEQAAKLAEQVAQVEAQSAMLAVLKASLVRQQEEMHEEARKLAADRIRQDDAQHDLDNRLRDAEHLTTERDGHAEQARLIAERSAVFEATLNEIQQQKNALAAEQLRLQQKEQELDTRTTEIAGQTAMLQARAEQVAQLHERLEAERTTVTERQLTLTDSDIARQTFQEQLRRRAEELSARSKSLDETTKRLADEKAELETIRADLQSEREKLKHAHATTHGELDAKVADLDRRTSELTDREANLERQVTRIREVGKTVAGARRELAEGRKGWDSDKTVALEREAKAREEFLAFYSNAVNELQTLRSQTPDLMDRAKNAFDKLTVARDGIRNHLGELHTYAGQTREELDAARRELSLESERLHDREQALEKARSEHRLAVTEFRQQLVDWQSKVGEIKQGMVQKESHLEARHAEVNAVAKQIDVDAIQLARQADELRHEIQRVAERRTEVERHLSDMREWYRRKLKELAYNRTAANDDGVTVLPIATKFASIDEVDPGDKQLGEMLQSLELIDAESLNTLWSEARRQRRTLRNVLLSSGTITIYQLALMEAGKLDALVLGRLRVIDRLRVTPREVVYRVLDPNLAGTPTKGVAILRHLAEAEMEDAVRPDEFRQMFGAAHDAAHPNLAATLEVLEINGRPAVLQEWLTGLPSPDWPTDAAIPGVWVKLLSDAAKGLDAAHRQGLTHGRLSSDTFLMTANGTVKLLGIGEPMWLSTGIAAAFDPTPEADLRAIGQIAFGWSQLGQPSGKRRTRTKAFPESLMAVVRRLEADPETPMADTVAGAMPYRSSGDLVADLKRLTTLFPCPADAWQRFVQHVTDHAADTGTRQSA